ncbi:hypothetical protein QR680_003624 [Steinernema hermaphroditum]|uniref:Uncharacterized protein n=1 Tax=Steinernema hermaphroditum TaxID=289476 RepID=A0AA39HNA2_9BILA|nr:hypothetical protein QR680_003624 [Steinernema hermaphroditum]
MPPEASISTSCNAVVAIMAEVVSPSDASTPNDVDGQVSPAIKKKVTFKEPVLSTREIQRKLKAARVKNAKGKKSWLVTKALALQKKNSAAFYTIVSLAAALPVFLVLYLYFLYH